MKIQLVIAAHKPYEMPADPMYLPLQVGAAGKDSIGFARDDSGDNISAKNPTYCELTGLYWAWKNLPSEVEYIGLAHYRRHFCGRTKGKDWQARVLTFREAEKILAEADLIVPAKRRYYIENLYSHYAHTLDAAHLDLAREIIAERCPEYSEAAETVYHRTWGYMFNMFLMGREDLDDYCSWLFPILEELEQRVDISSLDAFSARLFGRVSEILFNVWLLKRQKAKGLRVAEVPLLSTEPVNWLKKGWAFLAAKFFGKKYKKSF